MDTLTLPFFFALAVADAQGQSRALALFEHSEALLDAHNCYPYEGKYQDRIDRALSSGFPVAIERDLACYVYPATGNGRIAVSHNSTPRASDPTLKEYFFGRVRKSSRQAFSRASKVDGR
jgi:hypothetical protein